MTSLRHLRSSTANKRPDPSAMVDGQLAMNYDIASPGLFFKDDNGTLVKVGPVHVGTTAPNVSPAAGGTAGNSIGEQWLDTTSGVYVLKVWDGSAWRSESGTFVDVSGDTMTGALTMANQQAVRFSETTANGSNYIALQAPAAIASNKTITLPDTTGTIVTTGDTGTVTSTMIENGTILNADVNASAAIAGTKVSPDFGSQTIATSGIFSSAAGTAAAPSIAFTGDLNTGIYSPGADQLAVSTGGTGRLFVDSSGRLLVGTSSAGDYGPAYVGNTSSANTTLSILSSPTGLTSIHFGDTLSGVGQYAGYIGYEHTANYLNFGTDGVERLRIDSSGRLLVGTSSARSNLYGIGYTPSAQFETSGALTNRGLSITYNGGNTNGSVLHLITSRGTTAGSNAIVASGDELGAINFLGTDGAKPLMGAAITAYVDGTTGTDDMPGRLVFFTTADGASSPTERMRIDSTGVARFTAGPEAPAYRIRRSIGGTPRNVGAFDYDPQADGSTQGLVVVICQGNDSAGAGGVSLSRGATSWASYSDERAKTDLVPIDDGLTKVSTLRAITGRYIDDEPGTSRSFLIAQDVQSVLPEAVDAGDQDKLNLRYTEVIPLLVAALKESKERIETLEAEVAALKAS